MLKGSRERKHRVVFVLFLRAATTKSQPWMLGAQGSVSAGSFLLRSVRACAPCSPTRFWWFASDGGHDRPCKCITLMSVFSVHTVFSVCVCLCPNFPVYEHIGHAGSGPPYSSITLFQLIASAMTVFPKPVTFGA